MNVRSIKKEIDSGKIQPIYVCFGTEKYAMDEFVVHLSNVMIPTDQKDMAISKYDLNEINIEEVIEDAETTPFLMEKKLIIADQANFLTGARENRKVEHHVDKLLEYIKKPVNYSVVVLLVHAEKLDERKKIVKQLKEYGCLIPFLPLNDEDLTQWVQQESTKLSCSFEKGAIDQFILYTGGQLQNMSMELEKLSLFVGKNGTITMELIESLVVRNAEQNVFILIDQIVQLHIEKAMETLHELLKQREEPIKILSLMARQFRIILMVKELAQQGYSQRQIASQVGVHPYAVKIAAEQGKKYQSNQLMATLSQLSEIDFQIKSGRVDKVLGLELLLLKIAS